MRRRFLDIDGDYYRGDHCSACIGMFVMPVVVFTLTNDVSCSGVDFSLVTKTLDAMKSNTGTASAPV